jgi:O-succinylbenzoic acid--CoA ligase
VTHLSLVPTQLERLLAKGADPLQKGIKRILVGGASASSDLRRQAREAGLPIVCTYGMTEMASQVCTQDGRVLRDPSVDEVDSGFPLPGVVVRLSPTGEIHVRGPQLARAYFSDAKPLQDADGFYQTGDLGRFDEEGRLIVLGRKDHMLISGGENVYPEAVEAALLGLSGVAAACAFGVPDPLWGDRIEAAVEMNPGIWVDPTKLAERLISELREHLPAFAIPKHLWFRDALPVLPSGKTDRKAITAEFSARTSRDDGH